MEKMKYCSLYKASFTTDVEKECQNRTDSQQSIHFSIGPYKESSFLMLCDEIYDIMKKIQVLSDRFSAMPVEEKKYHEMMINEIVCTNRIEGIQCEKEDVEKLFHALEKGNYYPFLDMVQMYRKITEDNPVPVTNCLELREIYDELLLKDIEYISPENIPDGVIFRKDPVNVTSSSGSIHKGVYPENRIITSVEYALNVLNQSDIPCLVRVALFHYFCGSIHPFYDGNGRLARYITSCYLSKVMHPTVGYLVSSACLKRQKDYYKAFKITNDIRNRGDLTYFVIMFLDILKEEMEYTYGGKECA